MGRSNDLGAWGEELARRYLEEKGYRFVCRGYRSRYGEIDLILEGKGYLLFVEVKLRKNGTFARAMEYVDGKKQQRLRLTAEWYLAQHPTALQPRFDVVEIYAAWGRNTPNPEIYHWEDAFE